MGVLSQLSPWHAPADPARLMGGPAAETLAQTLSQASIYKQSDLNRQALQQAGALPRPQNHAIGSHTNEPTKPLCQGIEKTPIYVLNSDRRADRLQNLSHLFKTKMPWMQQAACRVSGLDGQDLGDNLDPAVISQKTWLSERTSRGPMTKVYAANLMSHARIWERVAQSDAPWSVVMEDNINYIHPKLGEFLCDLSHHHDDGKWELIQMQQGGQIRPGSNEHRSVSSSPMVLERGSDENLGMYILTKNAAKRLLKAYFPIETTDQLDSPDGFLRKQLRVFTTEPVGALQAESRADTNAQKVSQSDQGKQHNSGSPDKTKDIIKDCGPISQQDMIVPGLDKNRAIAQFL